MIDARDTAASDKSMNAYQSWATLFQAFFHYLRLRKRKNLLSWNFISRSVRYNALRLFSSHPMHRRSPLVFTLAVTGRCPLQCYHCSKGYGGSYELPAEVVLRTIDEAVELGSPVIALTGGEPFLRRELVEFLDRIPDSVMVMVYTCGHGLTGELAADLKRRPNVMVCFSLDHADPEKHDAFRGSDGAYDTVMRGIETLRDSPVEIHVSSIATRERVLSGELYDFARGLKDRGVTCVQFFPPRPAGKLGYDLDIYLRPEDEDRFLEITRELNRDPGAPMIVSYPAVEHRKRFGCAGGYARVYIDSHGHVCTCDFAPVSFGRVTEESFTAIWNRMRDFFETPGTRCQVCSNPEIFLKEREERNLLFSSLGEEARSLKTDRPGLFEDLGERAYRTLYANLIIASIFSGEYEARIRQ